ncbi:hypothetical protein W02_26530 [Nitrospira sp. KM1]|nr:hypothetical protein W02_26530 [Nitrospira sp. KM1]
MSAPAKHKRMDARLAIRTPFGLRLTNVRLGYRVYNTSQDLTDHLRTQFPAYDPFNSHCEPAFNAMGVADTAIPRTNCDNVRMKTRQEAIL